MENPLLNTISNSNISKSVNIKNNMSQTNTQLFNVSANLMPSERQTTIGVTNPSAVTKSNNEMKRFTSQRLYHPNGAPFTSYPELIRLLMDKDFRDCEINKINKHAREISYLRSIERTYSFYEICIMTRAAPAKILGLNDRGSLKKGSVADIAIYDPKKPIDKMFANAAQEEMEWAKYLFKDGSMLGLNDEILIQYMKHLCNRRTKAVGVDNVFEDTPNPIQWIKNWTESKHVQVAPQETQIETYKVGSFKQDTSETDFSDFNF